MLFNVFSRTLGYVATCSQGPIGLLPRSVDLLSGLFPPQPVSGLPPELSMYGGCKGLGIGGAA